MNAKEAYAAQPWLKHYPQGVVDVVDIPALSVPDLFDQMAEKVRRQNGIDLLWQKDQLGEA